MNKKLSILLALLLVSLLSVSGCKKGEKSDANKDTKKEAVKGTKKETKDTKKDIKKTVKKITATSSAKLDLSYFPEQAVVVGSFDVKAFSAIKELKPMMEQGFEEAKKNGIDLSTVSFLSYYVNIENLKGNNNDAAVLVSGLKIPENLLGKMGLKIKKEKYNDIDIMIDEKQDAGFAPLGNDLLAGSVKSIKKMIDVKKGKVKSLAKSDMAKEFNAILAKSNGAAFRIAFVVNKMASEQLQKLSQGQGAMAADFLKNLKSGSFSVSIVKDSLKFAFNFHSNKAGVNQVLAVAKPQLGMLTQPNSPMLGMVQPILGKEGTEILGKVLKTLKVNNDGEYLSVTFETKLEYWTKAPKIFGEALQKMNK